MASIQVRLGEPDRDTHERGHEWYVYDTDHGLDDLPWDVLDEIEQEIGPLVRVDRTSVRGLRLMMWVARRMAGVRESFASFKPHVFAYQYEAVFDADGGGGAGDADPPAGSADTQRGSAQTSQSAGRSTTSTQRSRGSSASRQRKSGS